jgi:urease accessory protein
MKNSTITSAVLFSAISLVPTLAHAHPAAFAHVHPGNGDGFTAGLAHPMMGMDHLLAMVAVGVWASQLGGRARWAVPAAFVGVMMLGSALGMAGVAVPMVESAILASVVVMGLLIATAVRVPLVASMTLVGLFAAFHGMAHGAEIPANASGLAYTAGFALATATLHATGFAVAAMLKRSTEVGWVRAAGVAIALCGAVLAIG